MEIKCSFSIYAIAIVDVVLHIRFAFVRFEISCFQLSCLHGKKDIMGNYPFLIFFFVRDFRADDLLFSLNTEGHL